MIPGKIWFDFNPLIEVKLLCATFENRLLNDKLLTLTSIDPNLFILVMICFDKNVQKKLLVIEMNDLRLYLPKIMTIIDILFDKNLSIVIYLH